MLLISLLVIALVVIIKNIRIMNNNLTHAVLEVPRMANIQSTSSYILLVLCFVYKPKGVLACFYKGTCKEQLYYCKLLRRFYGVVFFLLVSASLH